MVSPGLGAVVGRLRACDDQALLESLQIAEADVREAQARRAAVIAVVEERIAGLGRQVNGTADQVAVALAISPRSADHVLGDAISLVGRPLVWDGLYDGRIDLVKARLIVAGLDGVGGLPRARMEADAIRLRPAPHRL